MSRLRILCTSSLLLSSKIRIWFDPTRSHSFYNLNLIAYKATPRPTTLWFKSRGGRLWGWVRIGPSGTRKTFFTHWSWAHGRSGPVPVLSFLVREGVSYLDLSMVRSLAWRIYPFTDKRLSRTPCPRAFREKGMESLVRLIYWAKDVWLSTFIPRPKDWFFHWIGLIYGRLSSD